jgi:type II secretory pathway component PulM
MRPVVTARSIRDQSRPLPKRRLAAVAVLLLMAALYVSPVQKYLRAGARLHESRAQLAALQQRHDQLVRESQALGTTPQIELLARECGWVFPGEIPLVIEDIPSRDGAQCR